MKSTNWASWNENMWKYGILKRENSCHVPAIFKRVILLCVLLEGCKRPVLLESPNLARLVYPVWGGVGGTGGPEFNGVVVVVVALFEFEFELLALIDDVVILDVWIVTTWPPLLYWCELGAIWFVFAWWFDPNGNCTTDVAVTVFKTGATVAWLKDTAATVSGGASAGGGGAVAAGSVGIGAAFNLTIVTPPEILFPSVIIWFGVVVVCCWLNIFWIVYFFFNLVFSYQI